MNDSSFGNAVRARRKMLGMNQSDVARKAGIGKATMSDIETRGRLPRVDTAAMIATALLSTVDELLNWPGIGAERGPCK